MDKPKVVIMCGGRGTRLEDLTTEVPKPMVRVGGKPILWHIIKHYAHNGFREFILCLGYKGDVIRDYLKKEFREELKVTPVETGLETDTGERVSRVSDFLKDDCPYFLVAYSDHVSDVNLSQVVDYHKKSGRMVTIVGSHPITTYGVIKAETNGRIYDYISEFGKMDNYVNTGYMVMNKEFLDLLKPGMSIKDPFAGLIKQKNLGMFPHEGFFHAMDNVRDWEVLNKLWDAGKKHWAVWENVRN